MGQGGADRVTLILLQNLDRQVYEVSLLLMRKEGAHLQNIPQDVMVYDAGVRNLWFFLPAINKIIKKSKADIVFSTCGGANMPLSIAAFLHPYRKWKAILSERNILFPPGKNKLKRGIMLLSKFFFYRFADVLTAVSEGVRFDVKKKLGIPLRRIMVVDNPIIDKGLYDQANESVENAWFEEPRNTPVILHAGRFVHQKDHGSLIKAFALVRAKMECRLLLLGEGPLKPAVEHLVNDLGVSGSVCFAGFDPNPFKYMSKCDVFVLSSLHEGMPGVLIQAMACGAPSISTDCPFGPSEVIDKPGVDGILVPVRNPVALAGAIEKVLSDKLLRDQLKANGPVAVKKFEVEMALNSYLEAIEK
jgi:glycosyltransferase involved in cell wall biosynthesis